MGIAPSDIASSDSKNIQDTTVTTSEGYSPSLGNRQLQMIAIGGAIGVGLFLGSGGLLAKAGPALLVAYAAAGLAAFFVMRALGELVLYRPTAGSFVEYAREFIGSWAGYTAGWMYWLFWVTTGIAEITAVSIYMKRWLGDSIPQWITALVALVVLLAVNLLSVKLFGELEFWFAALKVLAIVAFLVLGIGLLFSGIHVGSETPGLHHLTEHGGFFPQGLPVVLMGLQAVIFAYSAIELVGIAAGEAKDPHKVMPKAINGVIWRIAIFYIGSIFLLTVLMPWTVYKANQSPFITVFSALGVPGIGDAMNLIVLIAAISSCNSGLYSTGRILRSLSQRGEAPVFTGRMNSHHVPYGGILLTGAVYLVGVVLNGVTPKHVFDIATAIASLGVLVTWTVLLYSQLQLRRRALRGELTRPSFRMPGAPITNWITLAFLGLVFVLMAFADQAQRIAIYSVPLVAVALSLGWYFIQRRNRLQTSGKINS